MTPEQLDEIEKRWAGYLEKNEVERRFLFDQWWDKRDFWDMTKALREAWAALEEVRAKNGSLADRMEWADSELRDAWKAEVRLRFTLRLLWKEALGKAPIPDNVCNAVEAALKEEE